VPLGDPVRDREVTRRKWALLDEAVSDQLAALEDTVDVSSGMEVHGRVLEGTLLENVTHSALYGYVLRGSVTKA
jgi:hypothetical protein